MGPPRVSPAPKASFGEWPPLLSGQGGLREGPGQLQRKVDRGGQRQLEESGRWAALGPTELHFAYPEILET